MSDTQLDRIEHMVSETHKAIYIGDGPANPPIMTRLDRLEQEASARSWWARTAFGAAIAAAVASIWALFTGTK